MIELNDEEKNYKYDALTVMYKMSLYRDDLKKSAEKIIFKEKFENKLKIKSTSNSVLMKQTSEEQTSKPYDPYSKKKN